MWVSVALEPLDVAILSEALSAPRKSYGVATVLTEEELVAACAGLVRIEHHTLTHQPVVSLSHLSVQEYLDKNRHMYFPDAHDAILVSSFFHLSSKRVYKILSPLYDAYLYDHSFS